MGHRSVELALFALEQQSSASARSRLRARSAGTRTWSWRRNGHSPTLRDREEAGGRPPPGARRARSGRCGYRATAYGWPVQPVQCVYPLPSEPAARAPFRRQRGEAAYRSDAAATLLRRCDAWSAWCAASADVEGRADLLQRQKEGKDVPPPILDVDPSLTHEMRLWTVTIRAPGSGRSERPRTADRSFGRSPRPSPPRHRGRRHGRR